MDPTQEAFVKFVEFAGLTQEAASLIEINRISQKENKSDIIIRVLKNLKDLPYPKPKKLEPTLNLGQGAHLNIGETIYLFLSKQSMLLRHFDGQAEVKANGLYVNGEPVKSSRANALNTAMKFFQEKRNHRNEKGELVSLSAWRQWHVERDGKMIPLVKLKSDDLAHRRGKFSGKIIIAQRKTNPRRPGSHGFGAFEIVLSKPEGISFEEYVKAGGETKHLEWDIAHGFVSIA